ncbi:DUF4123 domain-containing protein [Chromobacterium phragmitis]|uniref:DUF4123 domain-containing protein n=1 Tax=Chromobacterium phragmitis TaxID=2202141 RepID=UPI000DEC30D2|nr:DUF4123 domain-containing protein [Chromobacterium phragmitis]AXE30508.1 DUF4123 domain-containing protein [Chromobacterium phragmitis]
MMKLIHSFDAEALAALLQKDAPFSESLQQYLLLDGALNPGLLKHIRRSGMPWLSVFTQSDDGDEQLMSASPLLVQWEELRHAQIQRLLMQCDGMPMVSVWRSPESLPELAARLLPWCVVKADDQHFNLRFPDTRRLVDIVGVLDDEQRGQFFGPAVLCVVPTRFGAWETLAMPREALPPADKAVLNAEQTLALIRAGEADETLYHMQFHRAIRPEVLADCHPAVEQALSQADKNDVDAPDERYQCCLDALRDPAAFNLRG